MSESVSEIGDIAELQSLLAELGQGSVEGRWRGIRFEVSSSIPREPGLNFMSSVPGGAALLMDQRREAAGLYIAAAFPKSFMADLLLESNTRTSSESEEPLKNFRWSGTSKEYVETCLHGPLLNWLNRISKTQHVEVRDEFLCLGPLPQNPTEAAALIDRICLVIIEHFESWSMPQPNFDDDDDE